MCFGFGLIVANRYHVKGLRLFAKLVMVDVILTYLSLLIIIIIPICVKKYTIGIVPVIIVLMSYLMIFTVISFVPGYTVRLAYKLSSLLDDNKT
ncbi:unnamed protein product [Rotaria sp. Silwood2]|nr:unnamed protein product [Rotaria sp. Silwood2]CAF2682147.1 unnamed protein product [Rotaria sp. Silwood2]CAF2921260.1 unnamed protein product [Rotaria sp. Silwood2]